MKITNFHYSQAFPKVDFVEYPKWVRMEGYADTLAEHAEHEAELLKRPPRGHGAPIVPAPVQEDLVEPEPKRTLVGANDEREILWQIAQERGLKVDKRWNLTRLRAFIERETAGIEGPQ